MIFNIIGGKVMRR